MRSFVAVLFLMASFVAQAEIVNIDFESQTAGLWASGAGPIVDSGFEIDYPLIGVALWEGDSGDSNVAQFCATTTCDSSLPNLVISNVNGYGFALQSLDMGWLAPLPNGFVFTGHYANGGTVQKTVSTVNTIETDSGTMTNIVFGSAWEGLASLEIGFTPGAGFEIAAIDNIVVNTVPVPAAVWLFGSALAGLGWMRRR